MSADVVARVLHWDEVPGTPRFAPLTRRISKSVTVSLAPVPVVRRTLRGTGLGPSSR